MNTSIATASLLTLAFATAPGVVSSEPISEAQATHSQSTQERALLLDVEIDPIAYALKGHSVHVGLRHGHYRVDLGAFGLEMPEAFHGNEGFDSAFAGFGAKIDRSFREDGSGAFVGVDGAVANATMSLSGADEWVRVRQGTAGVRAGWRISLPKGFYVAPWVGVGANLGDKAIDVSGETFNVAKVYVFPTIHLGYVAF